MEDHPSLERRKRQRYQQQQQPQQSVFDPAGGFVTRKGGKREASRVAWQVLVVDQAKKQSGKL